ncbi:hypothetical protein ACFVAD_03535 [Sutcliffiella sp. NPDC057660]|uniref:hypothetical protein n=1 Tax=Sutcliffiella sp. NPDC057660 TaxID=3346199 RepID=UPI0036824997
MGDPTGEAEEAPIRPRGKQVSGTEINGLHLMFTFIEIATMNAKTAFGKWKKEEQVWMPYIYL